MPAQPFRFDAELQQQPSRFEYHFVHAEVRYLFELALTPDRIVEERLTSFSRGKASELYARRHETEGDVYKFGGSLEGTKELHNAWKDLTGPQTLFLAQAVANSSESLMQLRLPHRWFRGLQRVNDEGMKLWAKETQKLVRDNPEYGNRIAEFLQRFDVPVTGLRSDISQPPLPRAPDLDAMVSDSEPKRIREINPRAIFTHDSALGSAEFLFDEESQGTRNLIGFWLPWGVMSNVDRDRHPGFYCTSAIPGVLTRKREIVRLLTF